MSIFGKSSSFSDKGTSSNQDIKRDQNSNLEMLEDTKDYIEQVYDEIIEEERKQEESKVEYKILTSYLTDIQKIDKMMPEERQRVNSLANDIHELTKERTDYNEMAKRLTNAQYKVFLENEGQMTNIIQKMKEDEYYYKLIKANLDKEESEKDSLLMEKETIANKQKYISWLAKVTFVWLIVILALLLFTTKIRGVDIKTPMLVIIGITTLLSFYMIVTLFRSGRKIKVLLPKIKRIIRLLNREKIKYINAKTGLDYSYRKYKVNNYVELENNWKRYLEEEEKESKYRKSTGNLDSYANELEGILVDNNILEAKIWTHQAVALVDEKEMEEVRHNLKTRRQNLNQEIEARDELVQSKLKELKELVKKSPESKFEVNEYLKSVGLDL